MVNLNMAARAVESVALAVPAVQARLVRAVEVVDFMLNWRLMLRNSPDKPQNI
jgi:hypothetical protein